MKSGMKFTLFLIVAAMAFASAENDSNDNRPITKVVKLLKEMLGKSSTEGDEERVIFSKFKCYCDHSQAEKKESINSLTVQSELLESKIAELLGENGELSDDVRGLDASMAENKAAQLSATNIRDDENAKFKAEKADLETAIDQMSQALEMLKDIGADQTSKSGADHKQFMAQVSLKSKVSEKALVSLKSQVSNALAAATAIMSPKQRGVTSSFLQAPFTGTYTSQSAEVAGIFKSMRDTFRANLADETSREKFALDGYNKFIKVKKHAFDNMERSYNSKQKELGENDGTLSAKRSQLAQATKKKASEEEFLGKLLTLCTKKTKAYENRKMLRASEEAAIAETISILNSDAAFQTFGTVTATTKGSGGASTFIQLSAVHRHLDANEMGRLQAKKALQQAKSARLSKVLSMLKATNPFETVLGEIAKMLDVIEDEGKADRKKLNWCNKERKESNDNLKEKKSDILGLEGEIDKLTTTISDPATGLMAQIAETEQTLDNNRASQAEETTNRHSENVSYQKNVKNLVDAESILTRGIKALKAYYDDLERKLEAGEAAAAMLQKNHEDPAAPEAWKGGGAYAGQSSAGGDAVGMLEFIQSETVKEQMAAHEQEEQDQTDYEDVMAELKKQESVNEEALVNLQATLAQKQNELLEAGEDLKSTTGDKEAIETYLTRIKPGCYFIDANFDERQNSRKTETASLKKAMSAIKGTPAYMTFQAETTVESYGDCENKCAGADNDKTAACKACLAGVTVPAYCAGHQGTTGC